MSDEPLPTVVPPDLAGELRGDSNLAATYRAIRAGVLPALPGPGRKRIPLVAIEQQIGRALTWADIRAAEARLAPKRRARRAYNAEYNAARSQIAAA